MKLKRSELAVLIFTIVYVVGFGGAFLAAGNSEFVWYVVTLVIFLGLIASTQRIAQFPATILWALALWGLAHMAGGGVSVGEGVLYSYLVVLLANAGELAILKYDQIVHFYGFGVATLVYGTFCGATFRRSTAPRRSMLSLFSAAWGSARSMS